MDLQKRDIIVVGASAGGVEALKALVAPLPADLPAAVFVVQHIPPWYQSRLPEILSRAGNLPAAHAVHNQTIEMGNIYVAPPDAHLLLEAEGKIAIWHGPSENRFRPAINPLFRSAGSIYGKRVTGVVLTGLLGDGAAGLWWIKRYGGVAAVQDPLEALYPFQHSGIRSLEFT